MVAPLNMRILCLIPTLTGGGAERVMLTLLQHFDRSLIQPTLAVVNTRQAAFIDALPTDIELIDLGCRRVRHAIPAILQLVWRMRPTLVFSTLGHLNLALAMARPLLPAGTKILGREATLPSAALQGTAWSNLWRSAYRLFYPRLDGVICQSLAMQDDLCEYFGVPSDKTIVINNPVDIAETRRLAEESIVPVRKRTRLELVAAGRLEPVKGFDRLIDALAACQDLDVHLTLLGEGPLRKTLQARAEALEIAAQIDFIGFQNNPFPWYAQADALVMSSHYEGFPNVALEALVCGTPVIATATPGGLREILAPIPQCQWAAGNDAQSLTDAIRMWAMRRPERVSADAVSRFAAEPIVRRYEAEMLRIAGQAS